MSEKRERSPLIWTHALFAMIAVGIAATMAIVTACYLTACDPVLTAPTTVSAGADLVVTASSDDPPVTVTAKDEAGNHLPGSPDNGSDDPSQINTATFDTTGLQIGEKITVRAENSLGDSVTKIVEVVE